MKLLEKRGLVPFYIVGVAFSLVLFSATGFCRDVAVRDATDKILHFGNPPKRIVSLNPSATEILYALKVKENLIAVTQFCPFAGLRSEKENIGTILSPDVEKIILLKPDIVFATIEGNRKATVDNLRAAGVKVFVLDEIRNFNDIYARIDMMGKILQEKDKSGLLINEMRKKIGYIKQKVIKRKPLRVFLQLGADPLVTINKDTIINEIIEIAGGKNIAGNVSLRYSKYSREAVVIQNPDVIIIVSMGKFGEEALREWRAYKSIKAVRENRLCVIDSNLMCNMGPRLVNGVEEVAKFLHPEEFGEDEIASSPLRASSQ